MLKSLLIIGIIGLITTGTFLYFTGLPNYFLGEHKITEGLRLRKLNRPRYNLSFNRDNNLLYLHGSLDIGVFSALEQSLKEHPDSKGIILESKGGNIYQARGLARIIRKRKLNTYSFEYCYSACTLVYVAGKERFLGPEAKLGFHSYRVPSRFVASLIDVEKEQNKDLLFYSEQIPDSAFVDNIFHRKSPDIWIPGMDELVDAGVVHEILTDPGIRMD